MYTSDLIDAIRLPFRKDRELYRSFYHMLGFYPRHIQYYRQALMHKSMGMNVEGERPVNKLVQYQGSMQPHNSYVAGNAFEALVGAVYLDRGYNACRRFVERRILEHLIDIDKIAYQEVNFKSRLLEWTQKHRLTLEYELLSEDRDDTGSPVFRTRAVISGIECGRGTGYSKKESHQVASRSALGHIKRDKKLHATLMQKKKKEA